MKKRTKRTSKVAEAKFIGEEPTKVNSEMDYVYALNWYNYMYDVKTAKKWLEAYCKTRDIKLDCAEITMTMCSIARMLDRQLDLPITAEYHLQKKLAAKKVAKPKPKTVSYTPTPKFPLDYFEEALDSFYNSGYKSTKIDTYQHLVSQSARPIDARHVLEYYNDLLEEVKEGVGYEHLTKRQINSYIKLLAGICDDVHTYLSNNKKAARPRKTRRKKFVPASKTVSKMKYKPREDSLQLVSISPEKIVGAKVTWLYNTKYRKLIKLEASDETGLQVKGTTILNFDVDKSAAKRLRKPEETLSEVMQLTNRQSGKFFDSIKTKDGTPKGRTNEDVIILKAY